MKTVKQIISKSRDNRALGYIRASGSGLSVAGQWQRIKDYAREQSLTITGYIEETNN